MFRTIFVCVALLAVSAAAGAQECVNCHKTMTPAIVSDWELSKHAANGVDCSV
ncbi:MAG: cytochrome C, partial [Chitinivibrionia bacterium]|nr:cytochrome C [Chitinivibrionia bacterium]